MNRNNIKHATLAVMLATAVSICIPMTCAAAGIQYLATHADAIVVAYDSGGSDAPDQVTLTLVIERTLSGNVGSPSLTVVHPMVRRLRGVQGTYPVNGGDYQGMWFLVKTMQGTWDLLEPNSNGSILGLFLPAAMSKPVGTFSYAASASLYDALVFELANGIEASIVSTPRMFAGLFDVNSPAVTSVYRAWLASSNADNQTLGLAGILGQSQSDAISQLANLLPKIESSPGANEVIRSLHSGWRRTDPASVTQLVAFASSSQPGTDTRAAAVHALAAVHTKESLSFLANLLTSSDPLDQSEAIYGVSAFANGCPVQDPSNVVSMAYLQCNQPSAYRTSETLAKFGFRPGPPDQEAALRSYWQAWWYNHPEVH
jgi:hypothetical protein